MEYRKPELVLSEDAISTIQSHMKPIGDVDNPTNDPQKTSSAYEADE
jgi:hypothetical protein